MDADQINDARDDHERICNAIEKAIDADRTLVEEIDRWVAHLIDSGEIRNYEAVGNMLYGHAQVWTQQTGGSHEYPHFKIPLDTLNKFL